MSAFDLHLYISELFWLLVCFGCLYLLVGKVIVPMADRIVNNRQNTIDNNISIAGQFADKTKLLQEQYNNELAKISAVVENVKKEMQDNAERSFISKKARLNDELKIQIQQGIQDIESSENLFWKEDNSACINLAAFLIQKITNRPADLKLLETLIKK